MSAESILAYLGIALAVIGLVASYYFYKKSIRAKEPVYSIKSNNLISSSVSTLENLNISYKRNRVTNLTVSKILLYNKGTETITGDDRNTINPLAITPKHGIKLLDVSVLQINNPSSQITVDLDKVNNQAPIKFDYLDNNQGAVIQAIHTGLSSEDIKIIGDIKGVNKVTIISPTKLVTNKKMRKTKNVLLFFLSAFIIFFIIIWGLGKFTSIIDSSAFGFILILVVGVFFGTFTDFLKEDLKLFLFSANSVIPLGLEKFLE